MLAENIQVKLEQFDGPLGLLLMLIQKQDLNIRDLDIKLVTRQYVDYVGRMREIDFDVAGDYLYMAATLLLLKSKSCLSEEEAKGLAEEFNQENGITSRAELIRRLEELQRFQNLGAKLWELPKKGHDIFCRPKVNRKSIVDSILSPVELEKLIDAMLDLISRENRKYKVVKRDRLSIKEKLQYLKQFLNEGDNRRFSELLQTALEDTLGDRIITFISLLELARLQKVKLFQNEVFEEIFVDVIDTLNNFNVELADGFDPESESESASGSESASESESGDDSDSDSDPDSDPIPVLQ